MMMGVVGLGADNRDNCDYEHRGNDEMSGDAPPWLEAGGD
jgi:hypothetical protein